MLSMVSTLQGTPGLTLGESRGAVRLLVLLSLRCLLMRSVRRQEQALCLSAQTYHERGFASSASFAPSPLSGQRIVRRRPGFVTPSTGYQPPQVLQRSLKSCRDPDLLSLGMLASLWFSLGMGDGAGRGGGSPVCIFRSQRAIPSEAFLLK